MFFRPSFLSDDAERRTFVAAGKVAFFWGPNELAIESHIITLRNRQRDTAGTFPVSFSSKLRELRDRLNKDVPLASIRAAIEPVLVEAKRLHVLRVMVVHSAFQGQNLDGELMFGHSDQKRGVSYTEKRVTVHQLEQAALDMSLLYERLNTSFTALQAIAFR